MTPHLKGRFPLLSLSLQRNQFVNVKSTTVEQKSRFNIVTHTSTVHTCLIELCVMMLDRTSAGAHSRKLNSLLSTYCT